MRIGLVGSWKAENIQDWHLCNESGFLEASRLIGVEIARKNQQFLSGPSPNALWITKQLRERFRLSVRQRLVCHLSRY